VTELLEYQGTTMHLERAPELPGNHPRIVRNQRVVSISTGNHRGSHGTWEIRDGRIFLLRLDEEVSRVALAGAEPLFADWVSGVFVAGYGDQVARHPLADPVWARSRVFEIQAGRLVRDYETEPVPEVEVREWQRYMNEADAYIERRSTTPPKPPSHWAQFAAESAERKQLSARRAGVIRELLSEPTRQERRRRGWLGPALLVVVLMMLVAAYATFTYLT
jgi:hypothetical protein